MNRAEVRRKQIQFGSYMLGLISVWILGRNIGDNGIAYVAVALEGFYVLWSIIGGNVSETLGRMLRSKSARGQYKNASGMRRNVLLHQCFLGIIGSIIFFCSAGVLAERIFRTPYSKFLMMLLAPVIFIRTISEVFGGYFQGKGFELPTAVASILRQVLLLGFALLFGNLLKGYGEKVSALLGQDAFSSMYGGIGIMVAILLTELLITLFLCLAGKGLSRSKDNDGLGTIDSFGGHVRLFYKNRGGKILLCLMESLPLWMGVIFFQKSVPDFYASAHSYGVYIGKYLVLCGLAILLNAIYITEINARVSGHVRKEELREAKNLFQGGQRIVMIHALFFTVFVAIMGKQFASMIGGEGQTLLETMLTQGSVLIFFTILAFLFSRLLLLFGMELLVCACAAIADVVFVISTVLMLNVGGLGIMALVYAGIIGVGIYTIFTGVLVYRKLRVGIDMLKTLAFPTGCACLMGLLCFFLGKIFTSHLGNILTMVICLVLGSGLYWVLLILLRCFSEQELEVIPGGRMIRAIGQLLHV